jgi:hypothetical protein
MLIKTIALIALGGGVMALTPASAMPLSTGKTAGLERIAASDLIETVQYRRRPGVRPGVRPGRPVANVYRPYRGHAVRRSHRSAAGVAAAVGVVGVLGAIAASQAAAAHAEPVYVQPGPVYDDAIAYCMQRFRSYNPETGTYVGFDGRVRYCP